MEREFLGRKFYSFTIEALTRPSRSFDVCERNRIV
jgi:hypothetical protein